MSGPLGRIEFGGPDLQPRRLRDILQLHVDQAPPGSRIDWATYYFRDRRLAAALMRASDRGVVVRLVLERSPRLQQANEAVAAMLREHGLGGGFHLRSPAGTGGSTGHVHAKVYAFSDPCIAWIGSFNPSGDDPDDDAIIAEIGDQDRGDNLLLGIERPRLVRALQQFVGQLIDPPRSPLWRRLSSYWSVRDGDTRLYLFPRITRLPVETSIASLPRSASVKGAISHLKRGPMTKVLARAARRGVAIDLLVHETSRRVSPKAIARLEQSGARVRRMIHADKLPMHAKFLLVRRSNSTTAWLGSYNFNDASRLRNVEVLLATRDLQVIDQLSRRFEQIESRLGC